MINEKEDAISSNKAKPANNEKNNWPKWLKSDRSQIFLGSISLILSFISGLGFFPGVYYLFYLDKKVEKNIISKWLHIGAVAIPILGFIIYFFAVLLTPLFAFRPA